MVAMIAGVVMIIINKTRETSEKVIDKTIPNAVGGIRREASKAANRAELDRVLDSFLKANGGLWILKISTEDITLYTKDEREIDLDAPSMGYTFISEQYAEHVADKYGCEISKKYDTSVTGSGRSQVWVGTDINGNVIGGTTPDISTTDHYRYSMLYSREYVNLERAELRKQKMSVPKGKRV